MTDLLTDERAKSRARLADHIKQSATDAIADPGKEPTSRMAILGHLLNPSARVIESAITRFERGARFPTLDRERIADYITRRIENSVLGLSDSPLDLELVSKTRSAFAWSDRFAASCVQSGITEVRRSRGRVIGADLHALAETVQLTPVATIDWSDRVLSAEDLYLTRERHGLVTSLAEAIESWDERGLTATERNVERAVAVRALLSIPAACVSDDTHKRWLAAFLKGEGAAEAVRASLIAHRDLAAGDPAWNDATVHPQLLDLWADFTSEQAEALLSTPPGAAVIVAQEAAAFPPRPRDPKRVAVRRMLKAITVYKGWPTMVMRLERAWAAEFFDSHCEGDTRDGFDFEAARAEAAADWPAAAEAALTFPGRPFGPSVRTPADISAWMMRAYRLTNQQSFTREAA